MSAYKIEVSDQDQALLDWRVTRVQGRADNVVKDARGLVQQTVDAALAAWRQEQASTIAAGMQQRIADAPQDVKLAASRALEALAGVDPKIQLAELEELTKRLGGQAAATETATATAKKGAS